MYRLKVIAGPNQGASFAINDGETSIGRQSGNSVVLSSPQVSKRHCVLVASHGQLIVRDQGSANGTFVNGVLTRSKLLGHGDRLSVGEFVLELHQVKRPQHDRSQGVPELVPFGSMIQFPEKPFSQSTPAPLSVNLAPDLGAEGPPRDLFGKIFWYFEHQVMPIFYGLNQKYEWKILCAALGGIFLLGNLLISVYPLVSSSRTAVVEEAKKRATFMAQQIAEKNAPFLAARAETKTDVGSIGNAYAVRLAVLTDMDSRILAPGVKFNQYLTTGSEALFAIAARDRFRAGSETGFVKEMDSSTIVAVEPVRVVSPTAGRNVTVGMAIVSLDASLSTAALGEIGLVYSEALILTAILGALLFLILYRLTLKPFQVLGDDLDKVLKGELSQVTHEYQFLETKPVWDLVNAAVQRIPMGPGASVGSNEDKGLTLEELSAPLRVLSAVSKVGILLFDADRRISFLNERFESISGIRSEAAVGQDIFAVARDQAFGEFVVDLLQRAEGGGEGASDSFEFSGNAYQISATALGTIGSPTRGYLMVIVGGED